MATSVWGDVAVFVCFGLLGTLGAFALQTPVEQPWPWPAAAALGCLCVGVLNLNNLRDIDSDRQAGKRTVVVLCGETAAKRYQVGLIVAAQALWLLQVGLLGSAWALLVFLPLPILLKQLLRVQHLHGAALNAELPHLARLTLSQVGLLVTGVALA